MYSFDEIIPFIFSDVDSDPSLKSDLFSPEIAAQLKDVFSDLSSDASGDFTITLEDFTTTNDQGEERTFTAHTFNLRANNNDKILDDSCEGKVWTHYETDLLDLDTKEQFKLYSFYYESNYDWIGINVDKVVVKAKKNKKSKNMFVLVQRTPEDYNIYGIFKSVESAIEAFEQDIEFTKEKDSFQIDELPIGILLKYNSKVDNGKKNYNKIITGALNSYNLIGHLL